MSSLADVSSSVILGTSHLASRSCNLISQVSKNIFIGALGLVVVAAAVAVAGPLSLLISAVSLIAIPIFAATTLVSWAKNHKFDKNAPRLGLHSSENPHKDDFKENLNYLRESMIALIPIVNVIYFTTQMCSHIHSVHDEMP